MGIYLNPDNVNFKATLTRPIYVDKTGMISVVNGFMATYDEQTKTHECRIERFVKEMAETSY